MFLLKFKIHNFRSVQNTDWVEANQLTCLVGKNEAGKTNFLLPLFKFNPTTEDNFSLLNPKIDYPKSKYANFKADTNMQGEAFVSTIFSLSNDDILKINELLTTEEENQDTEDETSSAEKISFDEQDFLLVERDWKELYYFFMSKDDGEKVSLDLAAKTGDSRYKELVKLLPKFVYYSEYGNLDSNIHLPTIKQKIQNNDPSISDKDRQKIRTVKTLFEFTKLDLDEITELGKEKPERDGYGSSKATEEDIEVEASNKTERDNLLGSASLNLTSKFNNWWKNDKYIFRMRTDGSNFWIYVSDDLRKEEVELEFRSKGLQWFFSFYLVFLVESEKSHQNCILLLDEPGLSLHPNAQKDLIEFFNSLSDKNQLIYTTHLPFLVDHNNIDRVVGIFVDKKGISKGTNNLSEIDGGDKTKSIQPVNAAIGISAAESLLFNCQVVIVEGISDQFYLSIIKSALISKGEINPEKEIAFIPVKGVSGIRSTVSIIQGTKYELPYVIVDSDEAGRKKANDLKNGFYQKDKDKVIEISQVAGFDNSEIEDLIPPKILIKLFDKLVKHEEDFEDVYEDKKPIVDQMNKFLIDRDLADEEKFKGWKVEISKKFKTNFKIGEMPKEYIEKWKNLFDKFTKLF